MNVKNTAYLKVCIHAFRQNYLNAEKPWLHAKVSL